MNLVKKTPEEITEQNRGHILISGFELTPCRVNDDATADAALRAASVITTLLDKEGFFVDAPFAYIGMHVLYSPENGISPTKPKIVKKYQELRFEVEISVTLFQRAYKKGGQALLNDLMEYAVLEAVINAGRKYDRPVAGLKARRDELLARVGMLLAKDSGPLQ